MEQDNKKVVRLSLAITALVGAYLLSRGLAYVANYSGVGNFMVLGLFSFSALISVLVMGGAFVYVARHEVSLTFLSEVVGELKKVVWPGRKETGLSTVVVIGLVFFTAIFLWMVDLFWSWVMRQIIS